VKGLTFSQEEQTLRPQKLSDNQIRLFQEQGQLEEHPLHQKELLKSTIPQRGAVMVKKDSTCWFAPATHNTP